jgi:hypothetical protein
LPSAAWCSLQGAFRRERLILHSKVNAVTRIHQKRAHLSSRARFLLLSVFLSYSMNDTILSHHIRSIKLIESLCNPNRIDESICSECGDLKVWDHGEKLFACVSCE